MPFNRLQFQHLGTDAATPIKTASAFWNSTNTVVAPLTLSYQCFSLKVTTAQESSIELGHQNEREGSANAHCYTCGAGDRMEQELVGSQSAPQQSCCRTFRCLSFGAKCLHCLCSLASLDLLSIVVKFICTSSQQYFKNISHQACRAT